MMKSVERLKDIYSQDLKILKNSTYLTGFKVPITEWKFHGFVPNAKKLFANDKTNLDGRN